MRKIGKIQDDDSSERTAEKFTAELERKRLICQLKVKLV